MRVRYFLAINVPLSKRGLVKGSWYGSAYNEIFVNTEEHFLTATGYMPVWDTASLMACGWNWAI